MAFPVCYILETFVILRSFNSRVPQSSFYRRFDSSDKEDDESNKLLSMIKVEALILILNQNYFAISQRRRRDHQNKFLKPSFKKTMGTRELKDQI